MSFYNHWRILENFTGSFEVLGTKILNKRLMRSDELTRTTIWQFDNSLARCSFQLSWRTSVGTTHLLFRQWSKLCKTRFHFSLSARSWLLEKERGSKGWNGNFLKEENYLMIFYLFIRYFFSHTRKWRLICQRSHSYSLSTFVNETYKPKHRW